VFEFARSGVLNSFLIVLVLLPEPPACLSLSASRVGENMNKGNFNDFSHIYSRRSYEWWKAWGVTV